MRLTIDSHGEQLVARELFGIAGRAVDLRPAMVEIRDRIWDDTKRQFDSEGAFGSGEWDPLAPSTVAGKAAAGLDPRILHAKGDMERALTGQSGASIGVASRDGLAIGSTLPYPALHQSGTSRMPQRRPMQLPDRTRRDIPKIVQRYVIREGRGVL